MTARSTSPTPSTGKSTYVAECPGIYRMTQMRDGGLARLRIPGGLLSAQQLRIITRIASTHGNGLLDLTNRANLQIRGIPEAAAASVTTELHTAELIGVDPQIDRIRNITTHPLSGLAPSHRRPTHNLVADLDAALQSSSAARTLSPKFSWVIDGSGRDDLAAIKHDIGFFARSDTRFAVALTNAPTGVTISCDHAVTLATALIEELARAGKTRVKDLDDPTAVLASVANNAGIELEQTWSTPAREPRPVTCGYHPWADGAGWFGIGIPLARLTAKQANILADLATNHGDGQLRLTPWQSVILTGVSDGDIHTVAEAARAANLDTSPPSITVIACAGATGCIRTEADTKADGLQLHNTLKSAAPSPPRTIHLSGCHRGCAHPNRADILVHAEDGSANYSLFAGCRPSNTDGIAPIETAITPAKLEASVKDWLSSQTPEN